MEGGGQLGRKNAEAGSAPELHTNWEMKERGAF